MNKLKLLITSILILITSIILILEGVIFSSNQIVKKSRSTKGFDYISIYLFYYKPQNDKDENGNIKCSERGLVPIKRVIPQSSTLIRDTIELLLRGKENLTYRDIQNGITTEFPLKGVELKSANLEKNGLLILKFSDPYNNTSGGSCRTTILKLQIEKTAKQFPQVKEVEFKPDYLFQP